MRTCYIVFCGEGDIGIPDYQDNWESFSQYNKQQSTSSTKSVKKSWKQVGFSYKLNKYFTHACPFIEKVFLKT